MNTRVINSLILTKLLEFKDVIKTEKTQFILYIELNK